MSAIGIMDGAFFVGRKEIVDWVNQTLDLSINKVEDACSGALACELLDIMYPGSIPMAKVNWSANKGFEYVANYKLLQTGFQKNNIDKYIDVDRLIQGKYMDNLEFLQWFKRFFELHNASRDDYDVVGQRNKGKGGASYFPAKGGSSAGAKKPSSSTASKASSMADLKASLPQKPKAGPAPVAAHAPAAKTTTRAPVSSSSSSAASDKHSASNSNVEGLKSTIAMYEKTVGDLKEDVEATEKERDFYFEKLRDIELLLQGEGEQDTPLIQAIFKILYATADGFEVVANEGEPEGEGEASEDATY